MKPLVIESAINGGVTTLAANPSLPCTSAQVAADAAAVHEAGASIVHYHLRRIDGGRIDDYAALLSAHVDAIRQMRAKPEAPLLWNTFPIGGDAQTRFRLFHDLAADAALRPDFGAHDIGSLNIVWFDPDAQRYVSNTYVNTFDDVSFFLAGFRELGLRPFLNIFEPGFLRTAMAALDLGLVEEPLLIKLYFSERYGLPPGRRSVEAYLELLAGVRHEWFGCFIDGDVLPYVPLIAELGGHLRLGLEDFAYAGHPDGPLCNREVVERAVSAAASSGRPIATVSEARRLLGQS